MAKRAETSIKKGVLRSPRLALLRRRRLILTLVVPYGVFRSHYCVALRWFDVPGCHIHTTHSIIRNISKVPNRKSYHSSLVFISVLPVVRWHMIVVGADTCVLWLGSEWQPQPEPQNCSLVIRISDCGLAIMVFPRDLIRGNICSK